MWNARSDRPRVRAGTGRPSDRFARLEITEAPADQFCTPTLKRHNPKTMRKNVGEDYHGCLRIDVHRSADLYRQIEGWAASSMGAARAADPKPADKR
jgi:hypothetical protein